MGGLARGGKGKVLYFDKERFENIIIKLAKGRVAYDFDFLL
ncbi:hypothetical protein [Gracilibacillus sp. JCM 18860]